jgi:hypothetical protein
MWAGGAMTKITYGEPGGNKIVTRHSADVVMAALALVGYGMHHYYGPYLKTAELFHNEMAFKIKIK